MGLIPTLVEVARKKLKDGAFFTPSSWKGLNAIYICVSWYKKVADFQWKNADISKTQGVCHMIYIFFGYSVGKA